MRDENHTAGEALAMGGEGGHEAGLVAPLPAGVRGGRQAAPEGWVNGEQAQEMFGVSAWIWSRWVKEGRIRCGRRVGTTGRYLLYPIEALGREIDVLRLPAPFPPPGTVDEEGARRRFGVSTWKWAKWRKLGLLRCGLWVAGPSGQRAKVYPVEELGRVIESLRNRGPFPPAGFVGRSEAARMFGVASGTWKSWVVMGRVPRGQWFDKPEGGRCYLWAVEDLERLREELRGPDKSYWDPQNPGYYRVPPGYVRQEQAWRMFGVDKATWTRWEREGQVTCGRRVNAGGPKLYKVDDLHRLLEEYGRYAPPYPDPERPGVYRVPLSGHDIRRQEAVIDADDLPLVEGRRWGWCPGGHGDRYRHSGYVAHSKQGETTPLHRIILGLTDPGLTVMHLNDDPLDCRRANLVVRTFSERSGAARKPRSHRGRPCSSRFKGVCWAKDRGKWVAQLRAEGRSRLVGRFDDELAAAQAYDEAARAVWGEHARVNFPDGVDAWLQRSAA